MTQLIFRADHCEWISLRVGGVIGVEALATGEVDQVEEVLTGAAVEGAGPGKVGHLVTEIEEDDQEVTVGASVEASRTAPATVTLTGAHLEVVVVSTGGHLVVGTGGLLTVRSFGSLQQRSGLNGHGSSCFRAQSVHQ